MMSCSAEWCLSNETMHDDVILIYRYYNYQTPSDCCVLVQIRTIVFEPQQDQQLKRRKQK